MQIKAPDIDTDGEHNQAKGTGKEVLDEQPSLPPPHPSQQLLYRQQSNQGRDEETSDPFTLDTHPIAKPV